MRHYVSVWNAIKDHRQERLRGFALSFRTAIIEAVMHCIPLIASSCSGLSHCTSLSAPFYRSRGAALAPLVRWRHSPHYSTELGLSLSGQNHQKCGRVVWTAGLGVDKAGTWDQSGALGQESGSWRLWDNQAAVLCFFERGRCVAKAATLVPWSCCGWTWVL